MAIKRQRLKFEDHFTQVRNEWVRDERLSRRARGLLVELMSHAPGWTVTVSSLMQVGPEGRDALRSAIAELEEHGYLVREQTRTEDGKFADVDYVTADPWGLPASDLPMSENPTSGNPHTKKNIYKEDQSQEEQSKSAGAESVFDEVWKSWPKKDKKKPALTKFVRLSKDHSVEWLADQVKRFGDAYTAAGTDPQFVPALVVWLNQERWTDPLPQSPQQAKPVQPSNADWDWMTR